MLVSKIVTDVQPVAQRALVKFSYPPLYKYYAMRFVKRQVAAVKFAPLFRAYS
jgi:hypothetical protein